MGWIFENKEVTPEMIPAGTIGFVYLVVCTDKEHPSYDRRYIGKKYIMTTKTVAKPKAQLEIEGLNTLTKRTKQPRKKGLTMKVTKESDWKTYNTSHPELSKLLKAKPDSFKKIIIYWCKRPLDMGYFEAKLLFNNSAIESDKFWNDNVCGIYFKHNFLNVKT